jgi:hypothetical protein
MCIVNCKENYILPEHHDKRKVVNKKLYHKSQGRQHLFFYF